MRRAAVILAVVALACGFLTSCSPGLNSVAGIGRDAQGNLIGTVKVCDHTISRASLHVADGPEIGYWERHGSLRATESWQLSPAISGAWTAKTPLVVDLVPSQQYSFGGFRDDSGYTSHFVYFHGSDVLDLKSGEVLVLHSVSIGHGDDAVTRLAVIPLVDFAKEACPDY